MVSGRTITASGGTASGGTASGSAQRLKRNRDFGQMLRLKSSVVTVVATALGPSQGTERSMKWSNQIIITNDDAAM